VPLYGHFVPALNGTCSCPPMGRELGPNPARYIGSCQPNTKIFQVALCLGVLFFVLQAGPSGPTQMYTYRWLRIWEESGAYLPSEAITEAHRGAHAFIVRQSLSRGCHDHGNAVNQATTCPLLRSRRAPAAIFYQPRGQVGTSVTQLWPSPPPPRSFNYHDYPLFTGTNRGTSVNRGAEVTGGEVH
jgi:hypothetical protein